MDEPPALRIFVSYRRGDTRYAAGRLSDRLGERFGADNVFVDVQTIDPGDDYRETIEDAVRNCDVMLALIGQSWLSGVDEHGRRRLDDPDDLVVLEVRSAPERGVRVVPVLIDGSAAPLRTDLPTALKPLADRHAVQLGYETFRADVDALLTRLERAARVGQAVHPRLDESPDEPGDSLDVIGPTAPRYLGAVSALAGILLVFAAVRFALLSRVLTGPGQVSDAVVTTAVGAVGLGLLLVRLPRGRVAWLAVVGVFLGTVPFVVLRMWRSAELRGAIPPAVLESPLWMVLAALGVVVVLVTKNSDVTFGRLWTTVSITSGVAAAVGLVAAGCILPTSENDLATLRLSDPILLLASAALAVLVATTRALLRGAVLAGWAGGLCGVVATTIWLGRQPGSGISGAVLDAHLLLSSLTLAVLVTTTVLAFRRRAAVEGP